MRVVASGNLTVELIRAQRFDVACQPNAMDVDRPCPPCNERPHHESQPCIDRVELSPQALACDPWAMDHHRMNPAHRLPDDASQAVVPDDVQSEPEQLSPVVGSPALAGLGSAWVVPGTLLDVVA